MGVSGLAAFFIVAVQHERGTVICYSSIYSTATRFTRMKPAYSSAIATHTSTHPTLPSPITLLLPSLISTCHMHAHVHPQQAAAHTSIRFRLPSTLFGSIPFFTSLSTSIPPSPIDCAIQLLRSLPTPWWCDRLPPHASTVSRAFCSIVSNACTGSASPVHTKPK